MTDTKKSTTTHHDEKPKADPTEALRKRVKKLEDELAALRTRLGAAIGVSFND